MTHNASIARALHIADQALGLLRRGDIETARALRQRSPRAGEPKLVLFVSNDHDTLAGSQIYAARWRDDLARRGVLTGTCDVLSLCARDRDEVAANVGALVTWGDASQTVMRRFFGYGASPALVSMVGNQPHCGRDSGWLADLVVCSTHDARSRGGSSPNAVVLHPPVDRRYFEEAPALGRRGVAQVNLSKEPHIFAALARAMPDVPFVAVEGWGKQQVPILPNVRRVPRGPDAPMHAYQSCSVLIQPGVESYGIAAVEAAAMGLTVVARDCPGAREALAAWPGDWRYGTAAVIVGNDIAEWTQAVRCALLRASGRDSGLLARQLAQLGVAADALMREMGR